MPAAAASDPLFRGAVRGKAPSIYRESARSGATGSEKAADKTRAGTRPEAQEPFYRQIPVGLDRLAIKAGNLRQLAAGQAGKQAGVIGRTFPVQLIRKIGNAHV